jgi:hypothetical protein
LRTSIVVSRHRTGELRAPDPDLCAAPTDRSIAIWMVAVATEFIRSTSPPRAAVGVDGQNRPVDLARIGWLSVVVACLIAVVILLFQGYYGYAGVTFAVAASAGINLR